MNDCIGFRSSYNLTIIQGDYCEFTYSIYNADNTPVENIQSVVFSSKVLDFTRTLTFVEDNVWKLILTGDETMAFIPKSTITYDLTLQFTNDETPITAIYEAEIIIKRKENAI